MFSGFHATLLSFTPGRDKEIDRYKLNTNQARANAPQPAVVAREARARIRIANRNLACMHWQFVKEVRRFRDGGPYLRFQGKLEIT